MSDRLTEPFPVGAGSGSVLLSWPRALDVRNAVASIVSEPRSVWFQFVFIRFVPIACVAKWL